MKNLNAAIIIIGNEILSGMVLDTNSQVIATALDKIGIVVEEIQTIPDNKSMIIEAIKTLSPKYDYIFTSGGIGPTHDDITIESIAEALDLPLVQNQAILDIIISDPALDKNKNILTKMSYIPDSAELIYNDVTKIPSFQIYNIFPVAGIPHIMQHMMNAILPQLQKGNKIESRIYEVDIEESYITEILTDIDTKYQNLQIGSYPFIKNDKYPTKIVFKTSDTQILQPATEEFLSRLKDLGYAYKQL